MRRLHAMVRRRAIPLTVLAIVIVIGMYAENPRDWTQAASSCSRGTHSGEVTYVRDGDTLEVAGLPIRLDGLAAPESDDPGGSAATAAMRRLVDGRRVRCELTGASTYDRCVGRCYLEGRDIAAELVRQGVARDCPRYSGGRYAAAERAAARDGATIGDTYALPGYCR